MAAVCISQKVAPVTAVPRGKMLRIRESVDGTERERKEARGETLQQIKRKDVVGGPRGIKLPTTIGMTGVANL